jgi:hypothetical protein
MITLKSRERGFVIILSGDIPLSEMQDLHFQLRDEWAGMEESFVLVLDVRKFHSFNADAQAGFEEILEEAREEGLYRITTLGVSTAFASLFCNIMIHTELMEDYQFLDLAYEEDWRAEMESWLQEEGKSG